MSQLIDVYKTLGYETINSGSVDWFKYNGFYMPAYLPHSSPKIPIEQVLLVLRSDKVTFVRWDTDYDKLDSGNSEWYYLVKDDGWNMGEMKSNERRKYKKGVAKFTFKTLLNEEAIRDCRNILIEKKRLFKLSNQWIESRIASYKLLVEENESFEITGCYYNNLLVAYSENIIQDNCLWFIHLYQNSAYFKYYLSYAMVGGMLDYYFNERGFTMIYDGCRSLHHGSSFQSFLIRSFGFKKKYAKINVRYSIFIGLLISLSYPFRSIIKALSMKLDLLWLSKLNGLLVQETIRRT